MYLFIGKPRDQLTMQYKNSKSFYTFENYTLSFTWEIDIRFTVGYSDIGDNVVLMIFCDDSDVGGKIIMLATFFRYMGDFLNVFNRSPSSWITNMTNLVSVTNIDVTFFDDESFEILMVGPLFW